MNIGDRYVMQGQPPRYITITGVGSMKTYYIFDDDAQEQSLPNDEFSWWFDKVLPTGVQLTPEACDCGGAKTYATDNKLYHSHWCKIQGE